MTPFEQLSEWFTRTWQVEVMLGAKIGVVLFLFLFLLFTLVVVRQIKVMSETVTGVLEKELTVAAWILVGLSSVSIILALIIL